MSTATITRGTTLRRRRNGTIRQVVGFTTKPTPSAASDGIRRARLIAPTDPEVRETRIIVGQILKSYEPLI